jgi:hypothetical protein
MPGRDAAVGFAEVVAAGERQAHQFPVALFVEPFVVELWIGVPQFQVEREVRVDELAEAQGAVELVVDVAGAVEERVASAGREVPAVIVILRHGGVRHGQTGDERACNQIPFHVSLLFGGLAAR